MRETIVKLLQEKATELGVNVDLRPGSPMYIYLVDLLTAVTSSLLEQTAASGQPTVTDRADNFYVTDGAAEPSEFKVRLYFWEPTTLQYAANSMNFTAGGQAYSNKFVVAWPSQNMSFYTDGVYNYYDVTLEGEASITSGTSLVFDSPPTTFSHAVISTVTSMGSSAFTEDQLDEAIRRELSLRNNVTSSGVEAYLSNLYGANLKDILVQGFLDPEMDRDIYDMPLIGGGTTQVHMGGMVDAYIKGGAPSQKQLKFDNIEDDDVEITGGYTILESTTLPQPHLTSFVLQSWIRPAVVTFTDLVDYTVGLETGAVSLLGISMAQTHLVSGINIRTGALDTVAGPDVLVTGAREITFNGMLAIEDYLYDGHLVQSVDNLGATLGSYMVKHVYPTTHPGPETPNTCVVDSDIVITDGAGSTLQWIFYLEPVRCVYDYNPIGCKLEDFDAPVLSLDRLNILDPLTDEETDVEIDPMPGFGYGHFGLGGFGVGDSFGYFLHSFDELLRYSMRETGFLEVPVAYDLERVGVNYHTDALIASADTDLTINRARPADTLAFAFVPAITDFNVRLRAPSEIPEASISEMIWGMPGEMELSDVIKGLSDLGATYVNIDDLFNTSTYTVWSKDGVLSRVMPTSDGKITLSSITERFLPRSITITYED